MIDLLTYLILFLIIAGMNYLIDRFILRSQLKRLERSYQERCDLLDDQTAALGKLLGVLRKHATYSERVVKAVERVEELDKTY